MLKNEEPQMSFRDCHNEEVGINLLNYKVLLNMV